MPRFHADGLVERPGYVTVIQNGVCVLNHFEIQGSTAWDKPPIYEKHADRMPILLQNHGNPGAVPQYLGARVDDASRQETEPRAKAALVPRL